jgi:hypothetical protein
VLKGFKPQEKQMRKLNQMNARKYTAPLLGMLVMFVLATGLSSCKKCKGEDPRARVTNNGTKVASVQIKTSNGNTENINNVAAGTSSEYKTYAAGEVTFTITVDKINYVKVVSMAQCYEYNIAIDANNNITTTPTDRNN